MPTHAAIIAERFEALKTTVERQRRLLRRKEATLKEFCSKHRLDVTTGKPRGAPLPMAMPLTTPNVQKGLFDRTTTRTATRKVTSGAKAVTVANYLADGHMSTTPIALDQTLTNLRMSKAVRDRMYMPLCIPSAAE